MGKQDEKKLILLHDDHKKPTTRRDFLASGLLSFSGYMIAPSILTILGRANPAYAAGECGAEAATRMPAFINLNLSGGAGLASNVIPLDQGGNTITNLSRVGLGSTAPATTTEFGPVLFSTAAATNQMLGGIRATASATTLAKTSFVQIAVPSGDDTNTNQLDATGLVTKAGLAGELLPKLGRRNSPTGVGQTAALVAPPAPLVVRTVADLTNALAPAGAIAALPRPTQESLANLVSGLSGIQARQVASVNGASGAVLSKLVQCATDKNIELATTTNPGVDPRQDTQFPGVATAWQMANAGAVAGQNQNDRIAMGAMVYNALKGNAGAVGLDLGGYDYHGNARATTNTLDNNAGRLIGMALESAAQMNQPVMIYVTSDGGVGSADGSDINANFNGDRGSGGMAFMITFHPAGRPNMKNDRPGAWQLGAFTASGQSSDDQTIVGTPDKAAAAVFANYLKFANQLPQLEKVLPGQFTSAQLDYVLRFA